MPMRNLDDNSTALIRSIWGYAAGMMALIGVFGGGSDRKLWTMMVPPVAAATTTIYLLRQEEKKHHELQAQAEHLTVVEARLQNLETIVTKEEHLLSERLQERSTSESKPSSS